MSSSRISSAINRNKIGTSYLYICTARFATQHPFEFWEILKGASPLGHVLCFKTCSLCSSSRNELTFGRNIKETIALSSCFLNLDSQGRWHFKTCFARISCFRNRSHPRRYLHFWASLSQGCCFRKSASFIMRCIGDTWQFIICCNRIADHRHQDLTYLPFLYPLLPFLSFHMRRPRR